MWKSRHGAILALCIEQTLVGSIVVVGNAMMVRESEAAASRSDCDGGIAGALSGSLSLLPMGQRVQSAAALIVEARA